MISNFRSPLWIALSSNKFLFSKINIIESPNLTIFLWITILCRKLEIINKTNIFWAKYQVFKKLKMIISIHRNMRILNFHRWMWCLSSQYKWKKGKLFIKSLKIMYLIFWVKIFLLRKVIIRMKILNLVNDIYIYI